MYASCKPSRAAPPPPVPSHAPNAFHHSHLNGDRNNNRGANPGKIPTVIRPKMVETPTKKAPPRPPPPQMEYAPTRTTSLSKSSSGRAPAVPAPPAHKGASLKGGSNHSKGLHTALKKVKLFGKSGNSNKSSTSNANGEFLTTGLVGTGYGSYTNQALSQAPRTNGKKQAPLPPRNQNGSAGGAVATGTLISLDTSPSSPGVFGLPLPPPMVSAKKHSDPNNVRSLLDEDFPEVGGFGQEMCLLDMDIPPLVPTLPASSSVDNFGSRGFDPFAPQSQLPQNIRKSSLPITAGGALMQPLLPLGGASRIGQIREESNSMPPGSPPPPRDPPPQLNGCDTSAVHPSPSAMALRDHPQSSDGELAFSQYDLIELVSDYDDRYFMCRLDDQEGLVRKDHLEVLTPLEDSQQDSEPECLQDVSKASANVMNKRRSDDKPDPRRFNPRDPSSQPAWSAKPVASVSPLPAVIDPTSAGESRCGSSLSTSQSPAPPEGSEWAVAMFDFEAQRDDELGFVAGEKLLVESRYDQDWLYGCSVKGSRYGLFPAAFVQLASENDSETESLKEAENISSKGCELILPAKESSRGTEPENGKPALALFSFVAEQDGDLGFEEGETVWVLSRINKDWLYGKNARGDEGQFPASFVQPEGDSTGNASDTNASENLESSTCVKDTTSRVYTCLYDFEAQQDDDLTIHVGDKVQVTKMVTEEWWQGRVLGGQQEGIFPAAFVKPL